MITVPRVNVRKALESDLIQVDSIRPNSEIPRDPSVRYTVAERDGCVTAFFGLKIDPNDEHRALVVDFFGTNARDWKKLLICLLSWADLHGIELSAWVFNGNKNLKYFLKWGFTEEAKLIRRQPHKDVNDGGHLGLHNRD